MKQQWWMIMIQMNMKVLFYNDYISHYYNCLELIGT